MTITIPPLAIGALMEPFPLPQQCDFDKIGLPPRDSRTPPHMQPPAGAIVHCCPECGRPMKCCANCERGDIVPQVPRGWAEGGE